MGARGRKPAAADGLVIVGNFGKRPDPADDLTPRQAEIWRETVSSENIDFFSTAALRALLTDYCRHREASENVSTIINTFEPAWLKSSEGAKRYKDLLKMREMETRAAGLIATRLRLTNQSRYNALSANTAAKRAVQNRPWED